MKCGKKYFSNFVPDDDAPPIKIDGFIDGKINGFGRIYSCPLYKIIAPYLNTSIFCTWYIDDEIPIGSYTKSSPEALSTFDDIFKSETPDGQYDGFKASTTHMKEHFKIKTI